MTAALQDRLARIAGDAAVRWRTADAGGTEPVRLAGGEEPRAVVAPADAEGVAAVLAFCSDEGIPVRPAGRCTWLHGGRPTGAAPVVVSTARLAGIAEYTPGDLVVGARAGTPLRELEVVLRREAQTLPLDPPGGPLMTVGAVAALNSAGPLQALHGTPRDMLLGMDVVSGDGRLLRFGGRVVKNVAGYDVVRLLTGSRGTLGVITALYLRVRGAPAEDRTFHATFAAPDAAAAAALAVRDAMEPDALELHGSPAGGWTLAVRVRGGSAGVAESAGRIRDLLPESREAPRTDSPPQERRPAAGPRREAGPDMAMTDAVLCLRVAGVPGDLPGMLAAAQRYCRSMSRSDSDMGHPGSWRIDAGAATGVMRIWLPADASPPPPSRFRDASADLVAELAGSGWTWRYEVIPDSLQEAAPADTAPDAAVAELMARIRRSFDPAGVLLAGSGIPEDASFPTPLPGSGR